MEWGNFCRDKVTVPRWWEPPGAEGCGEEQVTRLQDHVTLGKTGLNVGNLPFWTAKPHMEV